MSCAPRLASAAQPAVSAQGASQLVLYIANPGSSERLNLRAAPDTGSRSLGMYYNGVTATVLDNTNPGWAYVRIGSVQGWMMRQFLTPNASFQRSTPTYAVSNPKASDRLNLRAVPSAESMALANYSNGETVEVLGFVDDWFHVRVLSDSKTGYMLSRFLSPVGGYVAEPDGIADAVIHTTNTGRLNLRAQPSEASASLGLYYNGVMVRVLENVSDQWAKVRVGESAGTQTGYMRRAYLTICSQIDSYMYPHMSPAYIPADTEWPLYSEPRDISRESGYFSNRMPVEVMGVLPSGWWHVRLLGISGEPQTTGFIPAKYEAILNQRVAGIIAPGPSFALNLREAPDANAKILGRYYNGTLVTVLTDIDDQWAQVRIGDPGAAAVSGYMRKDMLTYNPYLTVNDHRPERRLSPNLSRVAMRFSPSDNPEFSVVYIPDARTFKVLGEYGGWLHVLDTWDYQIGFIDAKSMAGR